MPQTRTVDPRRAGESMAESFASVAPTIVGVLVVVLACAIVVVVALATRPSGGLEVPKGSHVVHIDEQDFRIHLRDATFPPGQ